MRIERVSNYMNAIQHHRYMHVIAAANRFMCAYFMIILVIMECQANDINLDCCLRTIKFDLNIQYDFY